MSHEADPIFPVLSDSSSRPKFEHFVNVVSPTTPMFIGPFDLLYNHTMATNFWVVPQKPTTTNAVAVG